MTRPSHCSWRYLWTHFKVLKTVTTLLLMQPGTLLSEAVIVRPSTCCVVHNSKAMSSSVLVKKKRTQTDRPPGEASGSSPGSCAPEQAAPLSPRPDPGPAWWWRDTPLETVHPVLQLSGKQWQLVGFLSFCSPFSPHNENFHVLCLLSFINICYSSRVQSSRPVWAAVCVLPLSCPPSGCPYLPDVYISPPPLWGLPGSLRGDSQPRWFCGSFCVLWACLYCRSSPRRHPHCHSAQTQKRSTSNTTIRHPSQPPSLSLGG